MEKILQILNEAGLESEKSSSIASQLSGIFEQEFAEKTKTQECQNIIDEYGDGNNGSPLHAIREWGKVNLPNELYSHLSETFSGIKAIEAMMISNRNVSSEACEEEKKLTPEELASMISKPEYWNTRGNQELRTAVSRGFKDIYNKQI